MRNVNCIGADDTCVLGKRCVDDIYHLMPLFEPAQCLKLYSKLSQNATYAKTYRCISYDFTMQRKDPENSLNDVTFYHVEICPTCHCFRS